MTRVDLALAYNYDLLSGTIDPGIVKRIQIEDGREIVGSEIVSAAWSSYMPALLARARRSALLCAPSASSGNHSVHGWLPPLSDTAAGTEGLVALA